MYQPLSSPKRPRGICISKSAKFYFRKTISAGIWIIGKVCVGELVKMVLSIAPVGGF